MGAWQPYNEEGGERMRVRVKVFCAEHACHTLYLPQGEGASLLRRQHKRGRSPNMWLEKCEQRKGVGGKSCKCISHKWEIVQFIETNTKNRS